jgi:hypothetical protein
MVVAAACQIGDQLRVGQAVRIDALQLPVRGNGGGFAMFVPVAKLLAPGLLRKDLFGACKAFGDFGLWSRQHLVVAEDLQAVDEHPVEAREVVGALLEGGRMRLLEVACHRTRKVHGVLLPRARPGCFETQFGRGLRCSHGSFLLEDGRKFHWRRWPLSSRSQSRARHPFRPPARAVHCIVSEALHAPRSSTGPGLHRSGRPRSRTARASLVNALCCVCRRSGRGSMAGAAIIEFIAAR